MRQAHLLVYIELPEDLRGIQEMGIVDNPTLQLAMEFQWPIYRLNPKNPGRTS